MENLNRVELIGHVGLVKKVWVGDRTVAYFNLCTTLLRNDCNGNTYGEDDWFKVVAWEYAKDVDFDAIEMCKKVHVVGRLKMIREATYEVIASKVEEVKDEQD